MSSIVRHHVAISVADLDRTLSFYRHLGFRCALTWRAPDGSLTIAHLRLPTGFLLEVFCYTANTAAAPAERAAGNDLEAIGVKHLGLRVPDLGPAHQAMLASGAGDCTPITRGRTGIDYFFVRDPDGLWVEVVQDDRDLDPDRPVDLRS
ncbi:MAG: VOC family protein [Actinomycetota bacterium]